MAHVYLPGEVWRFKARAHEPMARVFVVRVDRQENGEEIHHVAIDNVAIASPASPGGKATEIQHLPVSRATLDSSVTERVPWREAMPDIGPGYETWHRDFAAGKAGVFDIPLRDILDIMERTIAGEPR